MEVEKNSVLGNYIHINGAKLKELDSIESFRHAAFWIGAVTASAFEGIHNSRQFPEGFTDGFRSCVQLISDILSKELTEEEIATAKVRGGHFQKIQA